MLLQSRFADIWMNCHCAKHDTEYRLTEQVSFCSWAGAVKEMHKGKKMLQNFDVMQKFDVRRFWLWWAELQSTKPLST